MNHGGQHVSENVNVAPVDGKVVSRKDFEAPEPGVSAAKPIQMNLNYSDPLDGKSGKDSLSEEEAVLS